jgi:uncharacterized protein (TIGR03118 family)
MGNLQRQLALAALALVSLFAMPATTFAAGYVETDLVVNQQVNGVPTLTDRFGNVHVAKFFDPHLVNPWGVAESGGSPFWVSDAEVGLSTLYVTDGTPQSLVVSIPTPGDLQGASGHPTGIVFNVAQALPAFPITGVDVNDVPITRPAVFLFATEDGTIAGWNPAVNPPGFDHATAGTHAIIAVDKSAIPDAENHAVYKGLAIGVNASGNAFLYATNFHSGNVDVYDATFQPAALAPDAFTDPKLPRDYAPFNIVPIGSRMFVTYAVQDEDRHDDVAGMSHGIVNTFDFGGENRVRFAQHGQLNSPWGVTLAPGGFGELGGNVLIGNFGNGHINAYNPVTGEFVNKLRNPHGQAIAVDGLWTVMFGNGGRGGDPNTLYFTAGVNDEEDGLFGSLAPH